MQNFTSLFKLKIVNNLFDEIISGSKITPPYIIENTLLSNFNNPTNVEWFFDNSIYEAIFYIDTTEHIAHFNQEGLMVDYKINLPVETIPSHLKAEGEKYGEVMNVIEFHKENQVSFEFIIRDIDLIRYKYLFTQEGEKISMQKL